MAALLPSQHVLEHGVGLASLQFTPLHGRGSLSSGPPVLHPHSLSRGSFLAHALLASLLLRLPYRYGHHTRLSLSFCFLLFEGTSMGLVCTLLTTSHDSYLTLLLALLIHVHVFERAGSYCLTFAHPQFSGCVFSALIHRLALRSSQPATCCPVSIHICMVLTPHSLSGGLLPMRKPVGVWRATLALLHVRLGHAAQRPLALWIVPLSGLLVFRATAVLPSGSLLAGTWRLPFATAHTSLATLVRVQSLPTQLLDTALFPGLTTGQ